MLLAAAVLGQGRPGLAARAPASEFESLRLAINDLIEGFGPQYPKGQEYLTQLEALERSDDRGAAAMARLDALRREALLANPLLDCEGLLLLKRKRGQLGLPVNHKCNSGIEKTAYDNEIAVLAPIRPDGTLRTLFRPRGSEFVGEMDLHYDAGRLLFTMPRGKSWHVFEINVDGSGLRQVTPGEHTDVDNFDGCYLPGGRVVFCSTASYHAVPCWHGQQRACSIYRIDADGSNMRQLTFDQDLDLHPSVLPSGQVIFSRWDYSGTMHMYLRPLMVMNPDGTGQRAVYGSNSYWPNALYFPRGIAGAADKLIAVVAGYHGVPRMGELGLLDLSRGWYEADGVVQRIPGRGKPIETVILDRLVDASWPKFLHPYPLSDKYFLVAVQPSARAPWGIYLADVFDNMVPVQVNPQHDFFEPIPLKKIPRPHVIPDRVRMDRDDGIVYLHDVYAGPGLAGVPRGTVKRLRVVAYHYGYPGMAGPDKVGSGGPWEVMRIMGTVPVHEDGSAMFRVPARTPITVQPLDAEGKAVQLMRSWFAAMPGESLSCTGCHEPPSDVSPSTMAAAMDMGVSDITPWYGPPRGFDFEREVQPVLDRYCVTCHNAETESEAVPDLRSERHVKPYAGRELNDLGAKRLHPAVRGALGGTKVKYTRAYEALVPYIRRVGIEDDVRLLAPGEYHADTSELIQMLQKGHHNVALDGEAWDRLVTWIDLNGPCHGTWGEVAPIPEGAHRRRRELALLYGGATDDPEVIPEVARSRVQPVTPEPLPAPEGERVECAGWPFDADEARRRQGAMGLRGKTIDLGGGVTMRLAPIPAGKFVMGDAEGEADERPLARVEIDKHFWMGMCEVTNEQFRRFDPGHGSGFFMKRYPGKDGPGLPLNGPKQPALRVSWQQAVAFCQWLSQRIGTAFALPTEAQWEYACRAGAGAPLSYGADDADFSGHGNFADRALSIP
ncbi:MAG: SUMF1/EgtB/PvdO family nonheme iron enzyme, partial [Candidatus Brocadiaceae bacterium]